MRETRITIRATLVAILVLLSAASVAHAGEERWPKKDYMTGETSLTSEHFKLHYVQGTGQDELTLGQAVQLRDWLEVAYARFVKDAGGTPNAGMRAPLSDDASTEISAGEADGKVDVYLAHVHDQQSILAYGGVGIDLSSPWASYIILNPRMDGILKHAWVARTVMRAITNSYANQRRENDPGHTNTSGWLSQSSEDWALAQLSQGGIPGHNKLQTPWLPLDCIQSWDGTDCGGSRGHWLFLQYLTQRYGPTLMHDAWTWLDIMCPPRCSHDAAPGGDKPHFAALRAAIAIQSGQRELEDDFRDFSYAIWQPETWQAPLTNRLAQPDAHQETLRRPGDVTPVHNFWVDHLSTRYVRITRPQVVDGRDVRGDGVRIEAGVLASTNDPKLLVTKDDGTREVVDLVPGEVKTFPFDGEYREIVIAFVNDTSDDDEVTVHFARLIPPEDTGGDGTGGGGTGGDGTGGGGTGGDGTGGDGTGGDGTGGDRTGGGGAGGGDSAGSGPPSGPQGGPRGPSEPVGNPACDDAKSAYTRAKRAHTRAKRAVRRAKSAGAKRRAKRALRSAARRLKKAKRTRAARCKPHEISARCGRAHSRYLVARKAYSRAKAKARRAESRRAKRRARAQVKRAKRKFNASRKSRARACW